MTKLDLAREFPVLNEVHFFNHGGVSPLPARSVEAMRAMMDDFMRFGTLHYSQWIRRLSSLRTTAATLLGCSTNEIAFVKNTTEGLMLVAEGLEWSEGDNIVTCEHEFPANVYPWQSLKRRGVELRIVPERDCAFEIEDFERAIDERTRLLTVSAVQFSTGFRMPLEELGQLCRERGALFCVDAIQALGVTPFDLDRWNVDFLSADGHKWLLGPEGFGLFYCRRERLETISNCVLGWIGVEDPTDYDRTDQDHAKAARRFEEGSHNLLGAHGLAASIDLLMEVGIEEVERRILALTRYLLDGLKQRGCEVFTPDDDRRRLGIVAFRHPTQPSGPLFKRLTERNIIGAHRRGWIRISPHFYNGKEQIDALLAALDA